MEHREPTRMSMSEGAPRDATDPVNPRKFPRFVTPHHVRRLAPSRIGMAIFAALSITILVVMAGVRLVQSSAGWLHRQTLYRVDPDSIVFDPPLPPWYRGGKSAFLERAKIGLGAGETRSALDLDLERLRNDLKLNCWNKGGVKLRREFPNRLTVHLQIRTPVAFATIRKGEDVIIDDEGVFLPRAEIDLERVGKLIQLTDFEPAPKSWQPGSHWKRGTEEHEMGKDDERIIAAAKLAGFLKKKLDEGTPLAPAQRFTLVAPRNESHGLAMGNDQKLWVAWNEPPGGETPDQPDAETKWKLLLDWMKQHGPRDIRPLSYLKFSKTDVGYR